MSSYGESDVARSIRIQPDGRRGAIVLMSLQGALVQGLVRAVEGYLPGVQVSLFDRPPTDGPQDSDVQLILIDAHSDFFTMEDDLAACSWRYCSM